MQKNKQIKIFFKKQTKPFKIVQKKMRRQNYKNIG